MLFIFSPMITHCANEADFIKKLPDCSRILVYKNCKITDRIGAGEGAYGYIKL